jgi:serine/threonine protein kinase
MHRWCSKCREPRDRLEKVCPVCGRQTDVELDINDTLRIDSKRVFVVTRQLSHHTDAGMSAVYLAARKDKPEMYGAIKLAKPARIEALKREAEHLQNLRHDHIIRLVHPERALWKDRKDGEELHFFALEYMDGGSLNDFLKKKGKLSLEEAVPVIMAVGRALEYAHQQGFVHLDVKPANILFGSDGRIVLSDFGITRDMFQAHRLDKRVGTFFYNSPEQLTDNPQHTRQADIYALGLILYEMLVGSDRFRQYRTTSWSKSDSRPAADSKPASTRATIARELPPPRQLDPHIPKAVERVILKTVAANPAERYDRVATMLDDLVLAISRPPRAKKWLLAMAGVGILLAIVLIVLGIFLGLSGPTEVAAPDPSPTPTPTVETAVEEKDAPTSAPAVVINVPSREPSAISTPASATGETLARMPTVTRAPTGTPTPVTSSAGPRQATVSGSIELVAPDNNIQIAGDAVEFRWIWRDDKGCLPPPNGYAFEIRVWRDTDIAPPMGAMDARGEQGNIRCDPTSGIRSFTIGRIRTVPGTENAPSGRFRWDVALIKLDPYEPVITTQYRTFFY